MIREEIPAARAPARAPKVLALGLISAVVLFASSLLALHGHVPKFDASLTNSLVQDEGSGWFKFGDKVSLISSGPVVGVLAIGFAVWALWKFRDVAMAAVVPIAAVIGGIAESAGKQLVGRLRPQSAVLIGEDGFGFPSGHTTGYTALAFSIVFVMIAMRKIQTAPASTPNRIRPAVWFGLAIGTSIIVAISRVLVGAHRVLDVIAGLALGIVSASVATLVMLPAARQIIDRFTPSSFQAPATPR